MINSPAPLAPELAMKEDLHGKEREKKLKNDKVKAILSVFCSEFEDLSVT